MEFEEKQRVISRIISGFSYVTVGTDTYKIYDYNLLDEYESSLEYDLAYNTHINNGALTSNELLALLIEKQVWNDSEDHKLKELYDNLKYLKGKLKDLHFQSKEKEKTLKYIDVTVDNIKKLEDKKSSLLVSSAEHLAKVDRNKFLLRKLTYTMDGKLKWPTIESFKNEPETLINKLLMRSYFNNQITEAVIRELARSEPWRSIWSSAVKNGSLFSRPATELTEYQRALSSWSIVYDSVYENMDCPSNDVINDDKQLDIWFEEQYAKREKNKNEKALANLNIPANATEVMIPVDSPEDAKKVYELNSPAAKNTIFARAKEIEKRGSLTEQNLPDIKTNLLMQFNNAQFNKHKK